jgi:hypothetical protein
LTYFSNFVLGSLSYLYLIEYKLYSPHRTLISSSTYTCIYVLLFSKIMHNARQTPPNARYRKQIWSRTFPNYFVYSCRKKQWTYIQKLWEGGIFKIVQFRKMHLYSVPHSWNSLNIKLRSRTEKTTFRTALKYDLTFPSPKSECF